MYERACVAAEWANLMSDEAISLFQIHGLFFRLEYIDMRHSISSISLYRATAIEIYVHVLVPIVLLLYIAAHVAV